MEEIVENFHSEIIPEPTPPEEKSPGFRRTLIDILETIVLSVVLFLGINAVSSRIRVESISMQPTLYAGNYVLVNKLAYQLGHPNRGDVIVFRYPPDPSQTPYIKRVIGLPGDQVHITGGKVYINGQQLVEPYLKVSTMQGGDWTVPPTSLFVMGDNRNNSSDSRSWGMVPLGNVIGKALVVYWPPQKWAVLDSQVAVAAGP
jgi:signal peptidase I